MDARRIIFCMIGLSLVNQGLSQIVYTGQPVTVTASRLFSAYSADTRVIHVIERDEIDAMPVESVLDILQYAHGLHLRTRGAHVQADFSLRGSSYEQILILLDGVRINDPQTGHHNSDIPVSVGEIERIEILAGHGSSLYGPDSYGGVIHIITKQTDQPHTHIECSGGSHRTVHGNVSQSMAFGKFAHRMSFEKQKSDGYRWDTDYDNSIFSWQFQSQSSENQMIGAIGYLDKDFGANGFYAPVPSREKTETLHANMGWVHVIRPFFLWQSKVRYRYHKDHFNLDYLDSDGYENDTQTWVGGIESQINFKLSDRKEWAAGVESVREEARSTKLGNHALYRIGAWVEMICPAVKNVLLHGGFRLDAHQNWGIQASPTLGLCYGMASRVRFRISVGRIFRAPTFTELFYHDDYNQGSAALQPETGWSYEAGLSCSGHKSETELTFFLRDEKDRIHWVRLPSDRIWHAANIRSAQLTGITITHHNRISQYVRFTGYYTVLHRSKTEASVYAFKYDSHIPQHHIKISATLCWPIQLSQSVFVNIMKYPDNATTAVLDAKWSRSFGRIRIYLNVTNLLNTEYEEISGIPMPGRQITLGAECDL